jgi:hypothetical protein
MDQAVKILAKYHGNGDINHPLVRLEIKEFEEHIKVESAAKPWDYSGLFRNRNARWRMVGVVFMSYVSRTRRSDCIPTGLAK